MICHVCGRETDEGGCCVCAVEPGSIQHQGRLIAAALRAEVPEVMRGRAGHAHECRGGCGTTSRHAFRADGYCDSCAGIHARAEEHLVEIRRKQKRELHLATARLLREEAAKHEAEAERT